MVSSTRSVARRHNRGGVLFIPTAEPVSLEEYRCIARQIVQVVTEDGFTAKKRCFARKGERAHGIDLSKLSAENLFYLPCQPLDRQAGYSTTTRIITGTRSCHQTGSNTASCRRSRSDTGSSANEFAKASIMGCRSAIAHWRKVGPTPGAGNYEFFVLGVRLGMAGMSESRFGSPWTQKLRMPTTRERRQKMASVFQS